MALFARTTRNIVSFVSKLDPAYHEKQVLIDPAAPEKGTKIEITIDAHASTFKVRPLDVFLMGYIYDNASSMVGTQGSVEVGIKTHVNQTNIDVVRFGLAALPDGWGTDDGVMVNYATRKDAINGREYTCITDEVLDSLGLQLVMELADKIKAISEVSAATEKKSVAA